MKLAAAAPWPPSPARTSRQCHSRRTAWSNCVSEPKYIIPTPLDSRVLM
ncbi:MAG: hypothetical protein R2856_32095 [Caldilineaceae bacterium]